MGRKKQRKGGIGVMGWREGGKSEMEAREVRYVGKLQKGRKFFVNSMHTYTKNHVTWMDTIKESNKTDRGVKRMRYHVVSQSLASEQVILKAVAP